MSDPSIARHASVLDLTDLSHEVQSQLHVLKLALRGGPESQEDDEGLLRLVGSIQDDMDRLIAGLDEIRRLKREEAA